MYYHLFKMSICYVVCFSRYISSIFGESIIYVPVTLQTKILKSV